MTNPQIIGRQQYGDNGDSRATTELVHTVSVPFEAGAVGKVEVEAFRSKDNEDRGGIVLRITVEDHGSSFVPYVKSISSGAELHMAGDIEAESLIHALRTALATL